MDPHTKDLLIASLISGGAIIAATTMPLNLLNLLCCGGILLGGFAGTVYFKKKREITVRDGVLIGLFGGLVACLVNALLTTINFFTVQSEMFAAIRLMWVTIEPATGILVSLVVYTIFGAVGGLIGGAIFQHESKK